MIDRSKLRMFIIQGIGSVLGMDITESGNSFIKLEKPLRIVPYQGDLVIAPLFIKEEWAMFSRHNSVEIPVSDEMGNMYADKVANVFGGIITPPEKKIII